MKQENTGENCGGKATLTNRGHQSGPGDLLVVEFLQGFREDKDFESAKEIINSLIYFDMLGKDIALKSALNYRCLRKKGITIRKTADIIIGTFCIERDFLLLHNDKDFEPMEKHLGLRVYSVS